MCEAFRCNVLEADTEITLFFKVKIISFSLHVFFFDILASKVNSSNTFVLIDSNGPEGLGDRDSKTWLSVFFFSYCLPVSRQQQTTTIITSSGRVGLPCINLKATLS